jgi:hypothetical protein
VLDEKIKDLAARIEKDDVKEDEAMSIIKQA